MKKVVDSLDVSTNYENDRVEIWAPKEVQVITRTSNSYEDGTTVIFRRRRHGDLNL